MVAAPPSSLLADFASWRAAHVARSGFSCTPIPFADSTQWAFVDGFLRHRTGGFFSVGGLATSARVPELDGQEQLILLQPETAINGLLWRRNGNGGGELLFQGRIEPGNCESLQLAPTVQSTEANYKRMHGGGATAFLEWFQRPDAVVLYDELQSEEATRYYGKYNRNVVVDVSAAGDLEVPPTFRWYGIDALREFVFASNVINTDARSVLAGLDWRLLAGRDGPFARDDGPLGAAMRESRNAPPARDDVDDCGVLAWLQRLRVRASVRHRVLPVHGLRNWQIDSHTIGERSRRHGFTVRQYAVHAAGREVAAWDQPLIDSDGVGRLAIVLQRRGGLLRVLLKASHEIGFLEGVMGSTSLTVVPGESAHPRDDVEAKLLALLDGSGPATLLHRCRQSEEGGRFHRDENDYELWQLDEGVELPASPHYRWLTFAQVARLMPVSGTFSMEFRGAWALLLHYV